MTEPAGDGGLRHEDLPLPVPSPWFGPIVAGIYAIVLLQLDSEAPFAVVDLRAAPAAAAGGVLFYLMIRAAIYLQDPRFWRNRARFEAYLAEMTDALGWRRGDPAEVETLRARLWRDAGTGMAWQGGLAAGAGAAVAASGHGPAAAALALCVTMPAVGLLLARVLMAEERRHFLALLGSDPLR